MAIKKPRCRPAGFDGKTLPCGRSSCLVDNLPERLVLEGYRHWMAGYETGSIEPWELGWTLFARALGARNGRDVFSAVSSWARECYTYAKRPPQTFPFESKRLCRHECVALALISALQNDDETVADFCLQNMVRTDGAPFTRRAASDLAETLALHRQRMMPVPYPVIASIALETPNNQIH